MGPAAVFSDFIFSQRALFHEEAEVALALIGSRIGSGIVTYLQSPTNRRGAREGSPESAAVQTRMSPLPRSVCVVSYAWASLERTGDARRTGVLPDHGGCPAFGQVG